jgi:hypothetical protein
MPSASCVHHWVLGDIVNKQPPPSEETSTKGKLRYRKAVCKKCDLSKWLRERDHSYVSEDERGLL